MAVYQLPSADGKKKMATAPRIKTIKFGENFPPFRLRRELIFRTLHN
jgi:hypothetical protein